MGKKGYLIIGVIVAGVFSFFIYRVNAKYPNPTVIKTEDSIEHDAMQYAIEDAGFYADREVKELWPDESFKHYRGYFVKLTVKNESEECRKIDLGDFELVSENAFTQGIDLQAFLSANGGEVKEKVYIDPGETGTFTFPFLVVDANFTEKQWEMLDTEQFGLVLELYPVKKEISSKSPVH